MGLGPPVCSKCMVIGQLTDHTWACPVCGSEELKDHLWTQPLEAIGQLENNTKFMKFIKGKDETSSSK